MLAQNFLNAETLGIPEHYRTALINVLGLLERKEFVHAPSGIPTDSPPSEMPKQFNLALWYSKNTCGTVCCIGGAAELLGATGLSRFTEIELDDLLMGTGVHRMGKRMEHVTVDQAAAALRNYLTRGSPRWQEVL